MSLTGDKILDALVESLSIEDLETLLAKKKNACEEPKPMTEEEKWTIYYEEQINKFGVLFPPPRRIERKKATRRNKVA